MSVRAIVTLGLALLFGISAAVLIKSAMSTTGNKKLGDVPTVDVVVTISKIEEGKLITQEMLTTKEIPADSLPEGVYLASEMESIKDLRPKTELEAGEQLYKSKLTNSMSMANKIAPDMVSFAIATPDTSSSNAGNLQSEDRVNVIFVPSDNRSGALTVTMLYNMRIITVNGNFQQQSTEGKVAFEPVLNVTMEMTPVQSELIAWSRSRGTLSLALRSKQGSGSESVPDKTIGEMQQNYDPSGSGGEQHPGSISKFVSPGKRGHRIKSDAGRLVPEDRVDVILTSSGTDTSAAYTLMTSIRVIVVNDQPQTTSETALGQESATTVVLDVTPEEDVLLFYAEQHGKISFSIVANTEQDESRPSMTLAELQERLTGKAVTPKTGPPSPDGSGNLVGARMIVNEMRNRAFGQTALNGYRKN